MMSKRNIDTAIVVIHTRAERWFFFAIGAMHTYTIRLQWWRIFGDVLGRERAHARGDLLVFCIAEEKRASASILSATYNLPRFSRIDFE